MLKDEQAALDVAQEVFVKIIEKKDVLDFQYPSSLLYRMATNLCLNYIRDHKKFESDGDDILTRIAGLDEEEHRLENKSLLDKIFRRQQESTRVIAALHFADGLTLEETAKEVGMSVSGVRKRLRILKEQSQEWSQEVQYHE